MNSTLSFGLLLATLAGLSTAIGGAIGIFLCRPKCWHLAFILGFSAGVMIYISFAELLSAAIADIGITAANLAFFIGFGLIGIVDLVIPHEYKEERAAGHTGTEAAESEKGKKSLQRGKSSILLRAGVLTALGIAIHNLPEGLVVFSAVIGGDFSLGILVAIAVGLHNIPEGISVFVPIFEATGSKRRAFLYSFLAGIAEPVGALIGMAILLPFLSPFVSSGMLAFAGGIMVYISLDELLPAAHKYGEAHLAIAGIAAGMVVMAVSLIIIR